MPDFLIGFVVGAFGAAIGYAFGYAVGFNDHKAFVHSRRQAPK